MAISFSLAQIEAFACVVESGSITHAAKRMGKDRTTVSELLDYLELDLGYALFDRRCRPFALTERGGQLYRQARLFLHEAQAFSYLAMQQQKQPPQTLTLSYDIFTPRTLLGTLVDEYRSRGVQLNLCYQDRRQGEQALEKGEADIGIYQAVNKSVSERFKWRAVGSVEMGVYARPSLFPSHPVSLLSLAACNQLIPNNGLEDHLARRLQIADRVQFVNDAMLLESMLEKGFGWSFLPIHALAGREGKIAPITTEMGSSGMVHPMVAIWQPGQAGYPIINQVLDRITELFAVG